MRQYCICCTNGAICGEYVVRMTHMMSLAVPFKSQSQFQGFDNDWKMGEQLPAREKSADLGINGASHIMCH